MRRYAEEGLDGVLHVRPQASRYRKLDDRGEAHLVALACIDAPDGRGHWTPRLLADKVVELGLVESLSYETARLRLKNVLKPCMASLYGTFSAAEARRNVKRLEFHHTPKPASWLNMAEIEFSVLTRDCLRGRHGDEAVLVGAIDAYQIRRYAPFCSGSLRNRWANDNGRL